MPGLGQPAAEVPADRTSPEHRERLPAHVPIVGGTGRRGN
jgi:hypothetical protein